MDVFIDNTGLLRVTNAKITALDGTTSDLTLTGDVTILTSTGNEVAGQTWPQSLTLNSAGDYSAIIESDLVLIPGRYYTALITFGTAPNAYGEFNVAFKAVDRAAI